MKQSRLTLNQRRKGYFGTLRIAGIVLIAFFLRSQELLSRNFLFLLDQGRDMMAVKSIVFDHHLTLIGPYTSLGGVFQGPLWYYLLALPTWLFGGDPWGSIVLMVVLSMTAMCLAGWVAYRSFGAGAGVATLLLFAVSPEAIAAATYSWNPHPMWLLMVLYVWFLFEVTQRHIRFHLFLWPTIALMFHFQTALGVFLGVGSMLYVMTYIRSSLWNKYFVIGLLFAAVLFLPQLLFDIRHDFLMTKSAVAIVEGQDRGLRVSGETTQVAKVLRDHLREVLNNFRSGFPNSGAAMLFPMMMLIFLIGVTFVPSSLVAHTAQERLFAAMILRIVIIVFILILVYPFPIRYWFLTGFQSMYLFLSGMSIGVLWRSRSGKALCIIGALILVFFVVGRLDALYVHPPDDGGTAKIRGKLAAINWIYADANKHPFGLFVFTPPVNTDAYDYLIWWRGRTRYAYVPYREKRNTFYLLMEPDSALPWSYQGWMDTVIRSGRIVSTTTLPSGFIIQKRFAPDMK